MIVPASVIVSATPEPTVKPSIEMKTAPPDVSRSAPARPIMQYVAAVRTVSARAKVTQWGDSASKPPKHPQPGAPERQAFNDAATNPVDSAAAPIEPIQRLGERSSAATRISVVARPTVIERRSETLGSSDRRKASKGSGRTSFAVALSARQPLRVLATKTDSPTARLRFQRKSHACRSGSSPGRDDTTATSFLPRSIGGRISRVAAETRIGPVVVRMTSPVSSSTTAVSRVYTGWTDVVVITPSDSWPANPIVSPTRNAERSAEGLSPIAWPTFASGSRTRSIAPTPSTSTRAVSPVADSILPTNRVVSPADEPRACPETTPAPTAAAAVASPCPSNFRLETLMPTMGPPPRLRLGAYNWIGHRLVMVKRHDC